MTIKHLIQSRRTIKAFQDRPVADDALHSWLEAASYAPNHKMNEPWELVTIGPETRAKLGHKTNFGNAPVLLAVLSIPGSTPFARDENIMAVSCFIQNFALAALEDGAGVFWSSIGGLPQNRCILGVKEGYDVVGVLAVGYPEEIPPAKPRTPVTAKWTKLP